MRSGDFRATLAAATGQEPSVATAPVVLAMTSTFWRNAWRYRERAYRHTFWDAGTSLAHILAVAASAHVATKLVFGYADPLVNALLDVDGVREATVALVALGDAEAGPPRAPPIERLDLPTRRLSSAEVTFHAITDMHLASSLSDPGRRPRGGGRAGGSDRPRNRPVSSPSCARCPPTGSIARPAEQIIFRRRSTRNYDTDVQIPFDAFSTLLDRSTRGVASDALGPGAPLTDLYLIVNAVEGLTPGIYLHHPQLGAVELIRAGTFRDQAARIAATSSTRATRTSTSTTSHTCPRSWNATATAATGSRSSKARCTRASCTSGRTRWGWARWAPRHSTTKWSNSSPPARRARTTGSSRCSANGARVTGRPAARPAAGRAA